MSCGPGSVHGLRAQQAPPPVSPSASRGRWSVAGSGGNESAAESLLPLCAGRKSFPGPPERLRQSLSSSAAHAWGFPRPSTPDRRPGREAVSGSHGPVSRVRERGACTAPQSSARPEPSLAPLRTFMPLKRQPRDQRGVKGPRQDSSLAKSPISICLPSNKGVGKSFDGSKWTPHLLVWPARQLPPVWLVPALDSPPRTLCATWSRGRWAHDPNWPITELHPLPIVMCSGMACDQMGRSQVP